MRGSNTLAAEVTNISSHCFWLLLGDEELALPMGWVDVKVCAVSEIGSGLKLVIRKALR
jgi:hypothetical protein